MKTLNRVQKLTLAVLAGMLAVFGGLMIVFRTHPGVQFEESLLKITEEDGRTVYSGRAHGEPVSITVTYPTNFETDVEFVIGNRFHDVCTVLYPGDSMVTEYGDTVSTIHITKNGQTLFEGGYNPEDMFGWYDLNGEWVPSGFVDIRGYTGGDPWSGYETAIPAIVRFALGPETAAHGDPALFGLAVFLSALLAVDIFFWKELFRFRHRWAADPEPSEGYESLEQLSWVIIMVTAAGFYIASMVGIY